MDSRKKQIYFDNAAGTPLDPAVRDAMMPYLTERFGNPSSIHGPGRTARAAIEQARKTIAALLHVSPAEIYFTAGGTEADNMALRMAVKAGHVKKIISSPVEHHAVLHTVQDLHAVEKIDLELLPVDREGRPEWEDILRRAYPEKTLVTLMHANNELGTVLPVKKLAPVLREKGVLFHSDMVQTVGHFDLNLSEIGLDMASVSAHKFHGPKGVGFLYVHADVPMQAIVTGGAQERNFRSGTENVAGIVGMAKALELACAHMQAHRRHVEGLRNKLRDGILAQHPGAGVNGDDSGKGLYTILHVSFPPTDKMEMLLFSLDIEGLAVSGGSACASGSLKGSHVLEALDMDPRRPSIRFSLSRFNTSEEVDEVLAILKKVIR